jgi:hypothetical protein
LKCTLELALKMSTVKELATTLFTGYHFLVLASVLFVVSCAQHKVATPNLGMQPGKLLLVKMQNEKVSGVEAISAWLKRQNKLPDPAQNALQQYPYESALLLQAFSTKSASTSIDQALLTLLEQHKQDISALSYIALSLYPIDAYRLADLLKQQADIDEQTIIIASLQAGLDPSRFMQPTASRELDDVIVPLIHSASLTLFNQQASYTASVKFKPLNSPTWQPALDLQWDPIRSALSGSIVHLEAATHYQVQVTISDKQEEISTQEMEFITRADTPPIDSNKIYYLRDFYQGGTLDLSALDIAGSEDGWAKIIGDDVVIVGDDEHEAAIEIGSQSYIMFENITVQGGAIHGIASRNAHHLWFNQCNISNWGRQAKVVKKGLAYASADTNEKPMNHDAGFSLIRTGVVVIENCEVHSPVGRANNWGYGHPFGPTAMLVSANHGNEALTGQYIIRNNRFYGSDAKRFNDVIESNINGRVYGGFVRDSAIYGNYLAYANDDIIELDGGQSNVLFYNNEIEQGYCGVSALPNMLGPSYIFNNYIHNLGDDRQATWAAIKLGGLMSAPAGVINIFENLVTTNSNGVAATRFQNDRTFWANIRNNIFIHSAYSKTIGFGVLDTMQYPETVISNNFIFNTKKQDVIVDAQLNQNFYDLEAVNQSTALAISGSTNNFQLNIPPEFVIHNFSRLSQASQSLREKLSEPSQILSKGDAYINFNAMVYQSFSNQNDDSDYKIGLNGQSITIANNSWIAMLYPYEMTKNTVVEFDFQTVGSKEIAALSFENDNQESKQQTYFMTGTQKWGFEEYAIGNVRSAHIVLKTGKRISGPIDRLVFVHDNDKPLTTFSSMTISNLQIYEDDQYYSSQSSAEHFPSIQIGRFTAQPALSSALNNE